MREAASPVAGWDEDGDPMACAAFIAAATVVGAIAGGVLIWCVYQFAGQ